MSRLVLVLVDVLVASIELLLDIRVSAIGIGSSLAVCARMSFASGTGDVVNPVGISVSRDTSCSVVSNCCVLASGILCGGIAVVCGRTGILWMESKIVAVGGCRIGPFLIQYKISVIDDTCSASVSFWR